ncbi:MAG: peptide chain release factor N(5)-glutamine methyltransferase [Xanthobacteraceae bacterium]
MSADTDGFAGLSVQDARREATARLREDGFESPEADARLLVGAATHLTLTGLATSGERLLSGAEAATLAGMLARRLNHEPVARILGHKEFWSLNFALSADTLVPRPETETVVSAGLELIRAMGEPLRPLRIADVGTGSGAILLALLSELPEAIGIGADISPGALRIAAANAQALGLAGRASFIVSDYCEKLEGLFDLIVSNPPYIARGELASLPREVREHDPRRALDGGSDGLVAYRALAHGMPPLLVEGGAFVLETGYRQADEVAELMQSVGLQPIRPHQTDLAGISRVVWGRKPES